LGCTFTPDLVKSARRAATENSKPDLDLISKPNKTESAG
jgi:hypothetical protein